MVEQTDTKQRERAKKIAKKGASFAVRKVGKKLMAKAGGSVLAAAGPIILVILGVLLLLLIVVMLVSVAVLFFSSPFEGEEYAGYEEVMYLYYTIYLEAEKEYGIPWTVLAGVHKVESDFGRNRNVSPAGAIGHMQFMPCTWVGWKYPGCQGTKGSPKGGIPSHQLTDPELIKRYGGIGMDANSDGKADPWDAYDAIFTAAKYLLSLGYARDPSGALAAYNAGSANSPAGREYAQNVMGYATVFAASIGNMEGIPVFAGGAIGSYPVQNGGAVISSPFGRRTDPVTGEPGRMHRGVDFAVPVGTPVYVPADGEVIMVGCDTQGCSKGYGKRIYIKHDGFYTLYGHLSHYTVKKGQKVKAGDMIALSGNTGKSTGPHLHWEVRVGNNLAQNAVDPLRFFSLLAKGES